MRSVYNVLNLQKLQLPTLVLPTTAFLQRLVRVTLEIIFVGEKSAWLASRARQPAGLAKQPSPAQPTSHS